LVDAETSEAVESTSTTDVNDDSNDEEAQQLWIQMRTIQRALESQDPKLKKVHLDSEGNVGIKVSESFDTYSGLSPCDMCRSVDKGVSSSYYVSSSFFCEAKRAHEWRTFYSFHAGA
jgi:hypothetical protein